MNLPNKSTRANELENIEQAIVTLESKRSLLGDQVAVSADDLKRLVSAWKGEESMIAARVYEQRVGVPAIFPRVSFSELSELRGDHGARMVLERNNYRLVRVPMANAAIDLDTPEDLAALTERFQGPEAAYTPTRTAEN